MSMRHRKGERGSVMVIVALWLPLVAIFASFAIDASHWWDFSRNLQNRADAAALAAGTELAPACLGVGGTATQTDVGQTAQQYAGPPVGTPSPGGVPTGPNLPYQFGSVPQPYQNQPNLGSDPSNFFLVLNGPSSYTDGGRNFNGGAQNFCSATYDITTPTVDVWATQANVPMFINMFGLHPNISAHARVQLEGIGGGNGILPIAVPDPAQTPCLRAEVINDLTGALVTDANGNNIDVAMTPPNPTGTPPQPNWTVTLPAMNVPAAQLSVQAYIPDDCANPGYPTGGSLYDGAGTGNGLAFINTYTPLPAGNPANPAIGSVFLTPAGCTDAGESAAQDAYFYYFPKSTSCTVTVNAQVKFPSGANNPKVFVSMDGGNKQQMTAGANNTYTQNFSIPSESGRHTFVLTYTGSGNGSFNGGNPLQATYSALTDGSDPPDDSGPVTQAFIGDNTGASAGVDSIQQGSSKTLTVAFHLQGLDLSQPSDPPIVLRAAVQNRKATGAFDCGQGTGANALHDAIVTGCPDPVSIFNPAQGCVFYTTAVPLTCAALVPGNRRNKVIQGFTDRINTAVDPVNNQVSPCDNWQTFKTGTPISGTEPWSSAAADPRIMIFVVTAPGDLSGNGGPTSSVRILGFATFYVTGFDGDQWTPNAPGNKTIPNCPAPTNRDENYPEQGTDKFQIWGHFIKYIAVTGAPSGQPCIANDVNPCVPALTR
jgi:hypothetical protein